MISVRDPLLLLESLLHFGPSHDGAVQRDLRTAIERMREDSRVLHELFAIAADRRYSSEIVGIRVRNELVQRATPEYLAHKSTGEQAAHAETRQEKNEREMAEGTRCDGRCKEDGSCSC